MVICGSDVFEFSVSEDLEEEKKTNGKRRIPAYLLACLLTLLFKELKSSGEQGRVVRTLNIIKH